jgi:uncharacterized phage infection (PIP) family protein YhgE
MKSLFFGAAAAVLLILCPSTYRIFRAYADQAPAVAWNLRTASWHAAATAANASTASANVAEASVSLKQTAAQLADPKTGAVAQVRDARADVKDVAAKSLAEIGEFRKTAATALDNTLDRVDGALYVARQTEADANARVKEGLADANSRVVDLENVVGGLQAGANRILDHAGNITAQVDSELPHWLDCAVYDDAGEIVGGNPDCLFNRYQGTSKAVEGIASDFHVVTRKFTAPRPLKAKIWDALTLGIFAGAKAVR